MEGNKYWFFGLPFVGFGSGTGENKYWFLGMPVVYDGTGGGSPPGGGTIRRLLLLGAG